MKPSTRFHLVLAGALAFTLVAGCSSASDVRSDSGPSTTDGSTTSAAEAGEEGTTTTPAADAEGPSDSKALFIQGSVSIPEGQPGQLSVVFVGTPRGDYGSTVPVVVRNNTSDAVQDIEINGTARGADGSLAGSGSSQGFEPAILKSGEWGFGYIYFDTSLAADVTVEATARGDEATDDGFFDRVPVLPTEVNTVPGEFGGRSYVGIVSNPGDKTVTDSLNIYIGCFDADSNLIDVFSGYADGEVVSNGTASFSIDTGSDAPECAALVVGASGYED